MKRMLKKLLDWAGLEVRKTRAGGRGFPSQPYAAQKRLLDGLGRNQPVIFDVGAHRGETVARYRALFPQARLYCYEANADNAHIIESRFAGDDAVKVTAAAVAAESGTSTFYINQRDATSSLLARSKTGRRYYHSEAGLKSTVEVPTQTIDDILRKESIDHIDILKFDIQGGELLALHGAAETLAKKRVSLIYSETFFADHYENNPYLHDLWKYLEQFDYSLFDIYDPYRATNGQLRFADVIFVSSELRRKVLDRWTEEP
jgi:FkbM family methyltransferase